MTSMVDRTSGHRQSYVRRVATRGHTGGSFLVGMPSQRALESWANYLLVRGSDLEA